MESDLQRQPHVDPFRPSFLFAGRTNVSLGEVTGNYVTEVIYKHTYTHGRVQTGLTPKPAATSYGEGFVFRAYKPIVQLRVVVCRGLEEGEEVVVTHHAITGTIPSHRIIFMCVP